MVTQVGDTEQPPQGESGAEEPELLLRPHLPCASILLLNQIWSEWNQLYRCTLSGEEGGGGFSGLLEDSSNYIYLNI